MSVCIQSFNTAERFNFNGISLYHVVVKEIFAYTADTVAAHFAFAAVKVIHLHFSVCNV